MINTPTMIATVDTALELWQVVSRIMADTSMTYKERYDLVDSILADAMTPAGETK